MDNEQPKNASQEATANTNSDETMKMDELETTLEEMFERLSKVRNMSIVELVRVARLVIAAKKLD